MQLADCCYLTVNESPGRGERVQSKEVRKGRGASRGKRMTGEVSTEPAKLIIGKEDFERELDTNGGFVIKGRES